MTKIFLAATALATLTACGNATDTSADPASQAIGDTAQNEAEVPSDEGSAQLARADNSQDGPEIGDRVPEPDEGDNSLAAAGAAEKARRDALEARGVTEIGWEELMPAGEEERIAEMYQAQMARLYSQNGGIAEGSAADQAIQIGTFNVVDDINGTPADGMKIRLPGYTVPFEYGKDAEISEFLLVPYYGACLHAPPPPPNQTVFVKTEDPIKLKDLSQAVWIEGTLRTQKQTSDLADSAYTIEMTDWEIYEY